MAAEFELGDHILVLDGRVLEIFRRDASESMRYHVAFVGVDAQPKGEGFKVRLGARRHDDTILGGLSLKMDREQFQRFSAFMALAIAARDQVDAP
ncbi:hypothetical protein ABZU32_14535 [Sphaerisporangium sp. NPDC005288]|uniref:hypothetical protein n=1 Tax=unclassified Sphaerisporangium TaxID=2630420 RepID=UPI0033BF8D3F